MKEVDARRKWCPMAGTDPARVNKRCIATDCMMWVWDTEYFTED